MVLKIPGGWGRVLNQHTLPSWSLPNLKSNVSHTKRIPPRGGFKIGTAQSWKLDVNEIYISKDSFFEITGFLTEAHKLAL